MYKYINVLISDFKYEERLFTYKVNKELAENKNLREGMRVIVPFGKKNNSKEAFVISKVTSINIDEESIKEIISIPDDFSLINEEMFSLAQFMSQKYCAKLADSINMIMPSITRKLENKEKVEKMVRLNQKLLNQEALEDLITKLEKSKSEVKKKELSLITYLKNLKEDEKLNLIEEKFCYSPASIKTLVKNQIIEVYEQKILSLKNDSLFINDEIKLTAEQERVYQGIVTSQENEFLIKGITGSGKTEIYIKLVENAIKNGRTGIILVPEIGLTGQMVQRFRKRFNNVSIIHSKLSASERLEEWQKVNNGLIDVVIGPRSAIFMPLKNIGVIVIDEEHEMTYKSEQTPKFKTSEVAMFRANYNGAKVVYASATPNVETYLKAKEGKIKLYELKERFNGKPLPMIKVIDMKEELEKGNKSIFSIDLVKKIDEKLKRKEQVIIFLNRRGFSTFVSCRKCGHVMKCPECEIPYVYHKTNDTLRCHYCTRTERNVSVCPNCGSKYIKYFGTGTEKVEQELHKIFGEAKILRMDADTTIKKGSQEEILKQFKDEKADILIGTQMVAKGHNFPNVTLVGILAADMMLNYQDFRAAERTFQLITQVAGRTGRAEKDGEVILQTYTPNHYAIQDAITYKYDEFAKKELMLRKQLKYPPYSNLFYITFSNENLKDVKEEINKLKNIIKFQLEEFKISDKIKVLGPGEATIGKLKNMYRWQIVLKAEDEKQLKDFSQFALEKYKESSHKSNEILIQLNFD